MLLVVEGGGGVKPSDSSDARQICFFFFFFPQMTVDFILGEGKHHNFLAKRARGESSFEGSIQEQHRNQDL